MPKSGWMKKMEEEGKLEAGGVVCGMWWIEVRAKDRMGLFFF